MSAIRQIVLIDEPRHSLWQQIAVELHRILSAAAAEVQIDLVVRIALSPISDAPTCFIGHAASRDWKTLISEAANEHCWILTSGGALSDEEAAFDDDSILRLSHVYGRAPHFHDWLLARGIGSRAFPPNCRRTDSTHQSQFHLRLPPSADHCNLLACNHKQRPRRRGEPAVG